MRALRPVAVAVCASLLACFLLAGRQNAFSHEFLG